MFVRDRTAGTTTRVSVGSGGAQANGNAHNMALSADGRFVAFDNEAANLVPNDTNDFMDVFVHDRATGETTRVSVSSSGVQAEDNHSLSPAISANGRYVAFHSLATDLVPGDTNGRTDVFVHDRQTGQTTRVSLGPGGRQGNDHSADPTISGNGRFVAFRSFASNLVPGDTNGVEDIFLHDRQTGKTTRLSVGPSGNQANGRSIEPALSANGRVAVFQSEAKNLVPGDTNKAQDIFARLR